MSWEHGDHSTMFWLLDCQIKKWCICARLRRAAVRYLKSEQDKKAGLTRVKMVKAWRRLIYLCQK